MNTRIFNKSQCGSIVPTEAYLRDILQTQAARSAPVVRAIATAENLAYQAQIS